MGKQTRRIWEKGWQLNMTSMDSLMDRQSNGGDRTMNRSMDRESLGGAVNRMEGDRTMNRMGGTVNRMGRESFDQACEAFVISRRGKRSGPEGKANR